MIFPRYPAYKASGAQWLGEVPAHWHAAPVKRLIETIESGSSVNSTDTPATQEEIGVLKTSCVYAGRFDPTENKTVVVEERERVSCPVIAETLIVSRMNTPELIGAAGLVRATVPNLFLPDRLWQISFRDACPAFIHYWTLSTGYRDQVSAVCTGTSASMKNIGQDQFGSLPVAVPPVEEQRAIAAFLDFETAKIDALVAEHRRLMELLQEKRKAVINHAVTNGINAQAPMRFSGVEWLGDVPAHWDVLPLQRFLEYLTSGSRGWAENYADDGAIFLRIANLTRGSIRLDLDDTQRVRVPVGAEGSRTRVRDGDILFSITAYLGSVAVIPASFEESYVSQHVALARVDRSTVQPEWVGYAALSVAGQSWFERQSYGGTKVQLSLDDIRSLLLPVPPLDEQREIVARIEVELKRIEELTDEGKHAVSLLNERRTALISAAVTGQIDVRGLAHFEAA